MRSYSCGETCTARRRLPDSKRDSKSSPSSSPSSDEDASARAPPAAAITAASALEPPDLASPSPSMEGCLAFMGEPRPLAPPCSAPIPDTLKGSVDGDGDGPAANSIGGGALCDERVDVRVDAQRLRLGWLDVDVPR